MTGVTGVDPSRTTASASARSGTPGVGSGRGTPVLDTLDKKSGGGKKKKKGKR
ncbi:hypothetical protein TREMEDRAFT_72299 [Tremella mesenterica DSM 1558]|nr:uncharacterized protein TREMEDRAFT_72299 [Tremella mesenterica DSM 1558]EIW67074.1 hypothetical protein TREMEDRAFT_72299 [Tremella mesenterica DSM 1558]